MLKVNAIYEGFQGEGINTGRKTTFIRLTGCNLHCGFCDTAYAWKAGEEMTEHDIIQKVNTSNVCITGGEPLYQDIETLTELLGRKHIVSIETNGSIYRWRVRADFWSISPKLSNSGMRDEWDISTLAELYGYVAQFEVQLKFVIIDPESDIAEALEVVKSIEKSGYWSSVACPIIFQPDGSKLPKLSESSMNYAPRLKEYLLKMKKMMTIVAKISKVEKDYDLRVLPQLHRLIYPELRNI